MAITPLHATMAHAEGRAKELEKMAAGIRDGSIYVVQMNVVSPFRRTLDPGHRDLVRNYQDEEEIEIRLVKTMCRFPERQRERKPRRRIRSGR